MTSISFFKNKYKQHPSKFSMNTLEPQPHPTLPAFYEQMDSKEYSMKIL